MGVAAVAVDAAHDTLIVAEKEDGETGDGVDEDQERPLLELAGYVVACDIVHGCCCWPVGAQCRAERVRLNKRIVCRAQRRSDGREIARKGSTKKGNKRENGRPTRSGNLGIWGWIL